MVEEVRLESVYTGNRIEGSNPSVSANKKSPLINGDFLSVNIFLVVVNHCHGYPLAIRLIIGVATVALVPCMQEFPVN